MGTQTENHVLSSASRQYDNESHKKFRSRSLSKKDTNNHNPEMAKSEMYEKHNVVFKEVFKTKAEKVPEIEDVSFGNTVAFAGWIAWKSSVIEKNSSIKVNDNIVKQDKDEDSPKL